MKAVCPKDPSHKAFFAAGSRDVACLTCHEVYRETKAAREAKPKRANKFNAVKVMTPLGRADSKKEGKRLTELHDLAERGRIHELVAHPKYPLKAWSPTGPVDIGHYSPDAVYRESDGRLVAEDVKSSITRRQADYQLRRKLFIHNYPHIEFRET